MARPEDPDHDHVPGDGRARPEVSGTSLLAADRG